MERCSYSGASYYFTNGLCVRENRTYNS